MIMLKLLLRLPELGGAKLQIIMCERVMILIKKRVTKSGALLRSELLSFFMILIPMFLVCNLIYYYFCIDISNIIEVSGVVLTWHKKAR